MRTCLILLSLLLARAVLAVPAWTWVDKSGERHYADRPVPGATRIELHEAQAIGVQSASASASTSSTGSNSDTQKAQPYTQFNVLSPSQQQTLWNIGGTLQVQVQLTPPLQPGHHLDAYLDGKLIKIDSTSPQFTVPNVYRGVHSLQAVVVDSQGNEVLRSLAVTFYVQQTSILNPNNPNATGRKNGGS
jgi:hypothetical protein